MATIKEFLLSSPQWHEVGQAGPGQLDDPNYSFGLLRMHPLDGYLADVFVDENTLRIQVDEEDSNLIIQSWNETDQELQLVATSVNKEIFEIKVTCHQVDCSKSGYGGDKQKRIFEIIKWKTIRKDPESIMTGVGILYLVSTHDLPDIPEGHEY